jgi:ribosomal protein L32
MPNNRTGTHHTEETKQKLRDIAKRRNYTPPSQKGHKASDETKMKLSFAHLGEKHHNWKGGISKVDKRCRNMAEYKEWRESVFKRDAWTCQECKSSGVYVTAHHINGFSKTIKDNDINDVSSARECDDLWDIDNGVTLCEDCHSETDNYRGRAQRSKAC